MKKAIAMIISILFLATISFAVVGCSKKEEPKPAETAAPATTEAAPATTEAAPATTEAAPATTEAAPATK